MKHSITMIPLVLIALFALTLSSCKSDGTSTDQQNKNNPSKTTNQPTDDKSVSYTSDKSIFKDFQEEQEAKDANNRITLVKGQIKNEYVTGTKIPGAAFDQNFRAKIAGNRVHIMAYLAHTGAGTEKNGSISPPNITEAKVALPTNKDELAFLLLNIEKSKLNADIPQTADKNSLNKANFNNTNPNDVIYKKWNLAKPTSSKHFNVYVFQVYETNGKVVISEGIDSATPSDIAGIMAAIDITPRSPLHREVHFTYKP